MKTKLFFLLMMVCTLSLNKALAQESAAESEATDSSPATPTTSECIPNCREGFVCKEGNCVTACNPPCTADQTCTSLGHCVSAGEDSASASSSDIPLMVPTEGESHPELGPGDPGWGYEAFVIGLVATAAITGLTAASAVEHGKSNSAIFGLSALGTFAVAGPVLAFGGMSARDNPIHKGYPTVRALSWIGYGLTLAGGIGLGIAGMDGDDVQPGYIAAVGVLGVLSTVGFSIDAYASAEQAESPVGQLGKVRSRTPSLTPILSLSPQKDGGMAGLLGLGGRF